MYFSLHRISAVEFSISQPSTNGLMYRTRPGFIPSLLLHKVQLSARRARLVEVLLADSIMPARLGKFMVVETSRAMVAVALLPEPQEADTAKHRHRVYLIKQALSADWRI